MVLSVVNSEVLPWLVGSGGREADHGGRCTQVLEIAYNLTDNPPGTIPGLTAAQSILSTLSWRRRWFECDLGYLPNLRVSRRGRYVPHNRDYPRDKIRSLCIKPRWDKQRTIGRSRQAHGKSQQRTASARSSPYRQRPRAFPFRVNATLYPFRQRPYPHLLDAFRVASTRRPWANIAVARMSTTPEGSDSASPSWRTTVWMGAYITLASVADQYTGTDGSQCIPYMVCPMCRLAPFDAWRPASPLPRAKRGEPHSRPRRKLADTVA